MHNGSDDFFHQLYWDSILKDLQCRQVFFWGPMDRDSPPTIFRRAYQVVDRRRPGMGLALGIVPDLSLAESELLHVYAACTQLYLEQAPRSDVMLHCLHPHVYVIGSPNR